MELDITAVMFIRAFFSSPPKKIHSSHQIFQYIHGALNVDKKLIAEFSCKS